MYHIVIKVGKYYIDSTGVYTSCKTIGENVDHTQYELFSELPIEVAKKWYRNPHQWNERFNRKQIPTVKKIVTQSYNKLVKSLEITN